MCNLIKDEHTRVRENWFGHSGHSGRPPLSTRMTIDEPMTQVQADLIHSMEKVERLQDALLIEKEHQIETLMPFIEDTVKTELKSYATVVKTSCSVSLAPRKLQAAIVKAYSTEERSNNLIVYGLEEAPEEEKLRR